MPYVCGARRRPRPRGACTCTRSCICSRCSPRWRSIAWFPMQWRSKKTTPMVLDAKALTWAAKNDIDTPKLKKARVAIYGKWYFPEIPAGIPLVNLETGEQQVFPERMIAGDGQQALVDADAADLAGIHMPSPSIAPLVLGVGFCILVLGAITSPVILVVGVLWMLAGAIGWIRIGLLEERAARGHDAAEVEHAP